MTVQRNEQGRFQLGNRYGKGRPPRQTEAGYLTVLMEECPMDTWRTVVRKAVEAASEGDDKSRHWLSAYLIGSPAGKAPTTTSVVISKMLGTDPALEAAAKTLALPLATDEMFPILAGDSARFRELELEAQAALLAAEEAGADA
ncbi:MAG: hypothetical protein KAX46_09590 [Chromatiaceae bacterium]|nr:hypothetical protein [Chromatiaceae bacterium]